MFCHVVAPAQHQRGLQRRHFAPIIRLGVIPPTLVDSGQHYCGVKTLLGACIHCLGNLGNIYSSLRLREIIPAPRKGGEGYFLSHKSVSAYCANK